jgi:hypothetical protein
MRTPSRSRALLACTALVLCEIATAARHPIVGRTRAAAKVRSVAAAQRPSSRIRRADVVGVTALDDNTDFIYNANITLSGITVEVQIDTGRRAHFSSTQRPHMLTLCRLVV